MFFRNLSLFRFSPQVARQLDRLDSVLADHRLRSCGPLEMSTKGFVPPVGRGEDQPLSRSVKESTLFTVGSEEKLLPAQVINEEVQRKVQKIAEEEGRKVGGRERKRIKEDVLTELLPRAFVRKPRISSFVDRKNGWIVIDTSSRKSAENVVTQVREALGSFPAVPLAPEEGPRILMTDWLATGNLPAGLVLGDECELRDPATATGARWKGRKAELTSEEVQEHLRSGKQVYLLGLVFDDRISFVLGEDLVIRKLKFLDVVMDELGDTGQDPLAELDASFALLTLELERLLAKMEEWFVLPRPVDDGSSSAAESKPAVESFQNLMRENGVNVSIQVQGETVATFSGQASDDPLLPIAITHCRDTRRVSISGVQRHLSIGYNRAARLIEEMERQGVVSAPSAIGERALLAEPV